MVRDEWGAEESGVVGREGRERGAWERERLGKDKCAGWLDGGT